MLRRGMLCRGEIERMKVKRNETMNRRWLIGLALLVILLIGSATVWGLVSPIGELAWRNLLGQSAAYITDEDGRIVGVLPRDLDHHVNPRDKSDDIDNLDGTLNAIVRLYETEGLEAAMSAVPISGPASDSVLVLLHQELFAKGSGSTAEIDQALQALGIESLFVGESYISLFVPIALLVEVANLDHIQFIEVEFPFIPLQSGSNVALGSNPVTIHGAAAWHAAGYTGKGIKIGIIDQGFANYASTQNSKAVPRPVASACFTPWKQEGPIEDCPHPGWHGTAVTEAVMNIAPEASVYLASIDASLTGSSWARWEAVKWMISQDVDIINYSMGHVWDSPSDGSFSHLTSPPGAVDLAVSNGVTWIQPVGNENKSTWHGLLNLGSYPLMARLRAVRQEIDIALASKKSENYRFDNVFVKTHWFMPGNTCNQFYIPQKQTVLIQMRWEDEWFGASRDLDFHIYEYLKASSTLGRKITTRNVRGASFQPIAFSGSHRQTGLPGDRPFEIGKGLFDSGDYCIFIHDYSARLQGRAKPIQVQLQIRLGPELLHHSGTGSINNPAESTIPGMLTVGAAHAGTYISIAEYSSRGPTIDGSLKPDLVGVAGAISTANNGNPFLGTSQAAPHVAGLAALVIQRFRTPNQFNRPEEVANYLRNNATLGIAGPTSPSGTVAPNNTWGRGLAWLPPPVPLISTLFSRASKGNLGTTAGCNNSGTNNSQCVPQAAGQIQADLMASGIREILNIFRKRIQTIPNFRILQEPSRIYVLVDTSGSMGGIKLEQATLNLADFIFELKGIAPEAHLSVIAFDNDVHPVGDKIITSWNNEDVVLSAGGGTDMYKAITYVYEEQVNAIEDGSRAIVIAMTDGISDPTLKEEALALIRNSKSSNSFFAIGYGADADMTSLRELTPSVQHVIQTVSVQFIFDAILQSITN